MGRTLPSITIQYLQYRKALAHFRGALRSQDRLAMDALFAEANHHLAEAGYATHSTPEEIFLIAMLLEEHKTVLQIQDLLEQYRAILAHLSDQS